MKNLITACFILIILPAAYGIGHYQVGDTLFAWAYHGLTCRTEPKTGGARITTIPYGASVIVESKDSSSMYTFKEFGGFEMRGFWTKVRYRDSLEGYVFDAYLSTFPAYIKEKKEDDFEDLVLYVESIFGVSKRSRRNHQPANRECPWKYNIYTFPKGAIVVQGCSEGGPTTTMEIPNFSFEEAYLWLFLNPKLGWQDLTKNYSDQLNLEITEQNRRAVRMRYELNRYNFEKKPGKIFILCWGSG